MGYNEAIRPPPAPTLPAAETALYQKAVMQLHPQERVARLGDASTSSIVSSPHKLGWGLLLAWVFCVFYLNTIGYPIPAEDAKGQPLSFGADLIANGLPVFASVATIGCAIACERKTGDLIDLPAVRVLSPLMASAGTLAYFLPLPPDAPSLPLFIVASAVTGMGSGIMWLLWGAYYSRIPQDEVEVLAPSSAVLAALLTLASSAMSGWVAAAFVAFLPIISGISLELSLRGDNGDAAARKKTARESRGWSPKSIGRSVPGIFIACVFVCLSGGLLEADGPVSEALLDQASILVALVFTLALTAVAIVGPRRISISFFYRWMCPALVLGFAAVILFPGSIGTAIAFVMSVSARFAFCLITQMYFARIAESGEATATQSFGWGWIGVHLGDFFGVVLLLLLADPRLLGSVGTASVAAVSIVVLVFATMFVLDDGTSFHSRSDRNEEARKNGSGAGAQSLAAHAQRAHVEGESGRSASVRRDALPNEAERESGGAHKPENEARPAQGAGSAFSDAILALAQEHRLTPREVEVFSLLARGRSIPYIRDELVISRETAATHAKHIYAKLGVHSRQELIDLATKNL